MKKIVLIIFLFSTIYSECIGDLNSDNIINISDAILLINIILEDGLVDELSDLNLDGGANILDIILLVNLILDNGNSCEVIWGQETTVSPYFYYASDIDSSQINQIYIYIVRLEK